LGSNKWPAGVTYSVEDKEEVMRYLVCGVGFESSEMLVDGRMIREVGPADDSQLENDRQRRSNTPPLPPPPPSPDTSP